MGCKIIGAFVLFFFLISCQTNNSNSRELNKKIIKDFAIYGQNVKVTSENCDTLLLLDIIVHPPTFSNVESKKLLISLICNKNGKNLNKFKRIQFNYIVKDTKNDTLCFFIKDDSLKSIIQNFQVNSNFEKLCYYIFNNVPQQELIKYNVIMRNLNLLMPDVFDFKGSYWLLLLRLSKNSSEYKKYLTMIYNASKVDEFGVELKHLEKIFEILQLD